MFCIVGPLALCRLTAGKTRRPHTTATQWSGALHGGTRPPHHGKAVRNVVSATREEGQASCKAGLPLRAERTTGRTSPSIGTSRLTPAKVLAYSHTYAAEDRRRPAIVKE